MIDGPMVEENMTKVLIIKRGSTVDLTLDRSPFTQKMQEGIDPTNFRFPSLEAFNDNVDPTKHIIVFVSKCHCIILWMI